jgi:hypothetical protein
MQGQTLELTAGYCSVHISKHAAKAFGLRYVELLGNGDGWSSTILSRARLTPISGLSAAFSNDEAFAPPLYRNHIKLI